MWHSSLEAQSCHATQWRTSAGPVTRRSSGFTSFWLLVAVAFVATFTGVIAVQYQAATSVKHTAVGNTTDDQSSVRIASEEINVAAPDSGNAVLVAENVELQSGEGKQILSGSSSQAVIWQQDAAASNDYQQGSISAVKFDGRQRENYEHDVMDENEYPDDTSDYAAGGRTIAGTVMNSKGESVTGADVTAFAHRIFDSAKSQERLTSGGRTGSTYLHRQVTDEDGSYTFKGLEPGEYQLKARSGGYLPARMMVRAGEDDVNLVLKTSSTFNVQGTVTHLSGYPLEGVEVRPNLSAARHALSDDEGKYNVRIDLTSDMPDSFLVRFQAEGYREQLINVGTARQESQDHAKHDIEMIPVNDVAVVAGIVNGLSGLPVPGETVVLYSPSLKSRYESVTDPTGMFMMQNIDLGEDYILLVRPKDHYKDYLYKPLPVLVDQMALNIALEPLETVSLRGQMVDLNGKPVSGYTLLLRGENSAGRVIEVTGDSQGVFHVNTAPLDGLVFESASFPQFRISNASIREDSAILPLVLDWGEYEIHGQILSSAGAPVTAPIVLTWLHTYNGVRSVSTRKTMADAKGIFHFKRVGPGHHTLTINAPGHRSYQSGVDASINASELLVRLQSG